MAGTLDVAPASLRARATLAMTNSWQGRVPAPPPFVHRTMVRGIRSPPTSPRPSPPLARLPQLGGYGDANPLISGDRTPKGRHYKVLTGEAVRTPSDGDPRRGLLRQGHAELVQQKLEFLVRPGVARQDEVPAVGGRQMDVHHLDGGERLDDGARGEA